MDVHEQSTPDSFWHDGTTVTFAKAMWKEPCTGSWKGPNAVLIWVRGQGCAFILRRKIKLGEINARTAKKIPWWHYSCWWCHGRNRKRFLNLFLLHHRVAVWEGREDGGDSDSLLLDGIVVQTSRPSVSYLPWSQPKNANLTFGYFILWDIELRLPVKCSIYW